jgi:hypothetical protein
MELKMFLKRNCFIFVLLFCFFSCSDKSDYLGKEGTTQILRNQIVRMVDVPESDTVRYRFYDKVKKINYKVYVSKKEDEVFYNSLREKNICSGCRLDIEIKIKKKFGAYKLINVENIKFPEIKEENF